MKISKSQLKRIIKEEISKVLREAESVPKTEEELNHRVKELEELNPHWGLWQVLEAANDQLSDALGGLRSREKTPDEQIAEVVADANAKLKEHGYKPRENMEALNTLISTVFEKVKDTYKKTSALRRSYYSQQEPHTPSSAPRGEKAYDFLGIK